MKKLNKIFISMFVFIGAMFFMNIKVLAAEYTDVKTFDELKAAIAANENVKLVGDFEMSESIKMTEQDITLDLNGHTITGKDLNETQNSSGNFSLFDVFKGKFTVVDSKGTGLITLEASTNRYWNAMSNIFHTRHGEITINGGNFVHLGGTDMAFVVDVSSNSYGDATLNVNGGVLDSSYTAVRLFMSPSGTTYLNITDGTLDGDTSAVWAQAPSGGNVVHTGVINISGGDIGIVNTARGEKPVVTTTISGGTVKGVKAEVGEVTITGGKIEESLTILTAAGEAVSGDEIITAGTFGLDASNFLASDVELTASVTTDEKLVYAVGKTDVVEAVSKAESGSVVVVDGDCDFVNVAVGTIVKAIAGSRVTANKVVVTEEGITIKAVVAVDVSTAVPSEKAEEMEKVLLDSLKEDEEVSTLVEKENVTVGIEITNIEEKDLDDKVVADILKKAEKATIASYLDISVAVRNTDTGKLLANINELSEKVTLMVSLPKELVNTDEEVVRTYYVIARHVAEGGSVKVEKLPAKLSEDGKSLTFETSEFSTYALAYSDSVVVENPKTFDGIGSSIAIVFVSLIVLAGATMHFKKEIK